jgi:hypothetical protein
MMEAAKTSETLVNSTRLNGATTQKTAIFILRQLVASFSLQRPGFTPRAIHVGFVVDKVVPGYVFLQILQFSPSISFHCSSIFTHVLSGD